MDLTVANNSNSVDAFSQHHLKSLHRWLLICLLCYLTFVIYGSLVPLEFVGISINDAWLQFTQIRYLTLGIHRRADWVANILLFIPLAYLVAAVTFKPNAILHNAFLAFCIVFSGFILSIGIEFTQLFFPQRTVSINDIIAETMGAILGVAIYAWQGKKCDNFLLRLLKSQGASTKIFYLLVVYCVLYFVYAMLPLDLTLSPAELFRKWRLGFVVLIPFSGYGGNIAEFLYAVVVDILLWLPIAILWLLYRPQQSRSAFHFKIILTASVVEFCQLFVYSRVTDISDVLCAFIAAILARFILKYLIPQYTQIFQQKDLIVQSTNAGFNRFLFLLTTALLYSLLLLAIFWYPFNFDFDRAVIDLNWAGMQSKVFLQSLYFDSEFGAISSLLRKVLTFFPLGVLLAMARHLLPRPGLRELFSFFVILYFFALACLTEFMQLALPGRVVDFTDIFLYAAGSLLGFSSFIYVIKKSNFVSGNLATSNNDNSVTVMKPFHTVIIHLALTIAILMLVTQLPGLPYNLVEVLTDNNTAIFGLVFALYVMILPLVFKLQRLALFTLYSPLIILGQSTITFIFLYFSVPFESLYDILGFPVTDLSHFFELLLRFIGFFSLLQFNFLMAGRFVHEQNKTEALFLWVFYSLFFAGVWYWVVVELAATDNITELLSNGGSFSVALMYSVYVALLFLSAAYFSRYLANSSRYKFGVLFVLLIISAILSWFLINTFTESFILKYQRVFSALQFLLSTDRANYADPKQLIWRYAIFHVALLLLMSWFYFLIERIRLSQAKAFCNSKT